MVENIKKLNENNAIKNEKIKAKKNTKSQVTQKAKYISNNFKLVLYLGVFFPSIR